MRMNRRFFLHRGALAVAGTTAMPNFLVRSVLAQSASAPGQRLVVIFQRGAADGLNVVVPYAENPTTGCGRASQSRRTRFWIWMDFSGCIRRWGRSSRYTSRGNWRLCMHADRRT